MLLEEVEIMGGFPNSTWKIFSMLNLSQILNSLKYLPSYIFLIKEIIE